MRRREEAQTNNIVMNMIMYQNKLPASVSFMIIIKENEVMHDADYKMQ